MWRNFCHLGVGRGHLCRESAVTLHYSSQFFFWTSIIFIFSIALDIQHYISFRCPTEWLDICTPYEGITQQLYYPSDTIHSWYNIMDYISYAVLYMPLSSSRFFTPSFIFVLWHSTLLSFIFVYCQPYWNIINKSKLYIFRLYNVIFKKYIVTIVTWLLQSS